MLNRLFISTCYSKIKVVYSLGERCLQILKLEQKPSNIEQIAREISFYKKRNPELGELFDLYFSLFKIELKYLPDIQPKIKRLTGKKIQEKIEKGESLLDLPSIFVDPDLFRKVIGDICEAIASKSAGFKESLKKLLAHSDLKDREEESTPLFIKKLLLFDTSYFTYLAKTIPVNMELLFFVIYHSITPFIEKASYSFRDTFDYAQWQRTICPICGRKPGMAKLRKEDGLRILQCSLCRSWWTYPNLKCVVCGNEDGETLQYFYSKEDEAHRVYVCNKCKKYIKTTDCRKLDRDINLEVEDLATIYLDLVAKERGYTPGGRMTYAVAIE